MTQRTDPVDLSNCDREPIHIPGLIQPVGFLLALTSDWTIARASANTADFIGLAPDALIGRPLVEIIPSEIVHELRNRTAVLRGPNAVERMFQCHLVKGAHPFDVAIHFSLADRI